MNLMYVFIVLILIMAFIFIFPVFTSLLNPFIAMGQTQNTSGLFKWFLTILPAGIFVGGIYLILSRGR